MLSLPEGMGPCQKPSPASLQLTRRISDPYPWSLRPFSARRYRRPQHSSHLRKPPWRSGRWLKPLPLRSLPLVVARVKAISKAVLLRGDLVLLLGVRVRRRALASPPTRRAPKARRTRSLPLRLQSRGSTPNDWPPSPTQNPLTPQQVVLPSSWTGGGLCRRASGFLVWWVRGSGFLGAPWKPL